MIHDLYTASDCKSDLEYWSDIEESVKYKLNVTQLIGCLLLLITVIVLSYVLLVVRKRRERFEIMILFCMFTNYSILAGYQYYPLTNQFVDPEWFSIKWIYSQTLWLGIFSHWIYVSQYLKTYSIFPSLYHKSYLVL